MSVRVGPEAIARLVVIGFGVTGRAVCDHAVRRGATAFVSEQRALTADERRWLAERGIPHEEGGHSDRALEGVDAAVLSPGVPMCAPIVVAARRRRIPVYSELDLAAAACGGRPIVAVTGTNGKSSTVEQIAELLRFRGRRAPAVGNIGRPFLTAAAQAEDEDAFVVEASSYQLEQSVLFRADVGVLLNFEPDHLARHGTLDAYAAAKGRLFELQSADDVAILPSGLAERFPLGSGRRVFYDDPPLALPRGAERLPPHQRANLNAALRACEALLPGVDPRDVPLERIVAAARLPHRMEPIGIVDGVRVIDDSKATNPASTVAALAATGSPAILLLGGRSKGAGYEALREAIAASTVRRIVLFGEAADELAALLEGTPADRAPDVESAVRVGLEAARPGDTLLFSPACASFDQFRSFEERGDAFVRAVRSRAGRFGS